MGGELVNGRGIDGGKPILIYINVLAGKPDLNFAGFVGVGSIQHYIAFAFFCFFFRRIVRFF